MDTIVNGSAFKKRILAKKEMKAQQVKRKADTLDITEEVVSVPHPIKTVTTEPRVSRKIRPTTLTLPTAHNVEVQSTSDAEHVSAQDRGDMTEFINFSSEMLQQRPAAGPTTVDHNLSVPNNIRYSSSVDPVMTNNGELVSN